MCRKRIGVIRLAIRVVERGGAIVCPNTVADELVDVSDATYLRCVSLEWFRGCGEGAYRVSVHSFFIFITGAPAKPARGEGENPLR